MDQSLLQDFITEAEEHLDEMEANLLELETDPTRGDALDNVFRNAHSIKGNAEYLGIEKVAALSHAMESLLDSLRSGQIKSESAIIDTLIRVRDRILSLVIDLAREQTEVTDIDDLLAELSRWLEPKGIADSSLGEKPERKRSSDEVYKDLCTLLYDITRSDVREDHPVRVCGYLDEFLSLSGDDTEKRELLINLKDQATRLSYHDDAGDILQVLKKNFGPDMATDEPGEAKQAEESYADESDQELFAIYAQHLKENLCELGGLVNQLKDSDDMTDLFKQIKETFSRLKSSANYMDYKKVVRLFEQMNADIESFEDSLFLDDDDGYTYFMTEGYRNYLADLAALFPQCSHDILGSQAVTETHGKEAVSEEPEEDLVPKQGLPEEEAQTVSVASEYQGLFDELDSEFDPLLSKEDVSSHGEAPEPYLKDLEDELTLTTLKPREEAIEHEAQRPQTLSHGQLIWEDPEEGTMDSIPPAPGETQKPDEEQEPVTLADGMDQGINEKEWGGDGPSASTTSRKSVRVDARKIDSLMNQAGELVVARAGFSQIFSEMLDFQHEMQDTSAMELKDLKVMKTLIFRLNEAIQSLGRVANELQDGVMKVRMLPISQLFNRYPRLVRDLTHGTDKDVRLVMTGEETELDKMVIEAIADPLVHMIRNAIDHGAETREERVKKGKPEACTLKLESYHESNHVVIEINDDGRGLDLDHIRKVAKDKGLLSKDDLQRMNDRDVTSLIMMPGFSTSGKVTKTSGRGVGMDVVKKNIEKLNGTIEIDSVKTKGTRIRIKIPLTLAIIKALLVKVGRDVFTIPLATVEETLQVSQKDLSYIEGVEVIKLRDTVLSLLRLSDLFNIGRVTENNGKIYVVVVNTGMRQVGLVVDELIGQEETVIKPLVDYLQENSGFSGATILGDGSISLILDVYDLITISMETRAAQRKSIHGDPGRRRQVMDRFGAKHGVTTYPDRSDKPSVH